MTDEIDAVKRNIFITGLPGIGKTTLIKKIAEELRAFHPVGFYTTEIRETGVRKGFELVSLDGRSGILSHTDIESPYRVGKYMVDLKGFEYFLDSTAFLDPSTTVTIIDEIGKMECLSPKFKKLIKAILNSEKLVLATIALKGSGFIEEIKRRQDIKLFEMTQDNRYSLLLEILKEAKTILSEIALPCHSTI